MIRSTPCRTTSASIWLMPEPAPNPTQSMIEEPSVSPVSLPKCPVLMSRQLTTDAVVASGLSALMRSNRLTTAGSIGEFEFPVI
ncbi:hypothetical protein D3C87_1925950 [compost metagenome]